jgi:nucleoside-diphosphate-sugar epimerase
MKALVTDGAGFIGSHLTEALLLRVAAQTRTPVVLASTSEVN